MSTVILGISALYHDAAAVLLVDGVVVAAAQEERFTRVKHDASLPIRAAKWCLSSNNLRLSDVDYLVFYEKPLRKFERILINAVATFPRSWKSFPRAMHVWLGDKLWVRNQLSNTFSIPASKILFCEHHLSHAASAFLCSPHSEAAILTLDGVGESASTTLWRGTAEPPYIHPVSEIHFPHSLGMLYSSITAFLGFAVNEGEYKVMGMAAFGTPKYRDAMEKLIQKDDQGGFSLDMSYFSFHYHPTESYSQKLVDLLGPPRFPGTPFKPGESEESNRWADIAASVQAVLEDTILHIAKHAKQQINANAICMAGGVALNSVANHRLALEGPFDHLWVQPAAGDAGGALGAALWAWNCVLGNPRGAELRKIDLGRRWTPEEVTPLLEDLDQKFVRFDSKEAAADHAAEELSKGGVIGWFEGGFEWGPRALGHRSILADPRTMEMKDKVNASIKFREKFRPFAPAITEEAAADWFDIPKAAIDPARFMLVTPAVREHRRDQIPSTTHIDGSARTQVVSAQDHPHFHRVIERFGQLTGVPVLMNTSFNLKGEAIVTSPVDAISTLLRCGLDSLYIEGHRVENQR